MLTVLLRKGFELKIIDEFEKVYKELHKACKEGNKERLANGVIDMLRKLDNMILLGNPELIMYKCDLGILEFLLMFNSFAIFIMFLPESATIRIWVTPPIAFEIHTRFPI
jgi:hypothetical protein